MTCHVLSCLAPCFLPSLKHLAGWCLGNDITMFIWTECVHIPNFPISKYWGDILLLYVLIALCVSVAVSVSATKQAMFLRVWALPITAMSRFLRSFCLFFYLCLSNYFILIFFMMLLSFAFVPSAEWSRRSNWEVQSWVEGGKIIIKSFATYGMCGVYKERMNIHMSLHSYLTAVCSSVRAIFWQDN